MFLKSLTISSGSKVIREINFRKGINLIVDETPITNNKIETGNNVGKTTVLKLIDFCLGADAKGVYNEPEYKKEYKLVKDFLKDEKVLITLILKEDLDIANSNEIEIERNFLSRKEIIRRINGDDLTEDEFELRLTELIFPKHKALKPTFRQIISHNLRYEDESITHTLRTLNKYSSDVEYETLHLFLLGCEVESGSAKQEILAKIKQEDTFKSRLEKTQTKTAYETALALINLDVQKLNKRKENLNLNENFENDLNKFNDLKYQISKVSSELSRLSIRRDIIQEAKQELESNLSNVDTKQLQIIYDQATNQVTGIQKTFEDLVKYHNQMIVEKVKFITQELPNLESNIESTNTALKNLLSDEKKVSSSIAKSDTFEDLEKIINELNDKFKKKGEYENIIMQLDEVENELRQLNGRLKNIEEDLFSDNFEKIIKERREKFNKHFASISSELYGEQYVLNYDITINKRGQRLYKFSTFDVNNPNIASGKKQGEISCFDIAYVLFADEEKIPCLHFVLNDKKELMHGNQLVNIANLVNKNNIQFVASILKDKLPTELNNKDYFVVELSQEDKLFRIENQ
jgi:uncharacterized protein YydD (DUF2326 family)